MSENNAGLKKTLGFWALFTIAVGSVVGDGIFTGTGFGVGIAGPSLVVVYVMVGILQLFLMLSFGELVQWKPSSGGSEIWVRTLVSKNWGAVSSLMFSVGWLLTGGSTGMALGGYTHNFLMRLGIELHPVELWITLFAIAWITIFCALNVIGVAVAARVQLCMVAVLVATVVSYEVIASFSIDPANYTPFMPNGFSGIIRGFPIAVYALMGASTVVFASGEAKKPVDVSRVLIWSSLTFIVMYGWALLAAIGTVPSADIQQFAESLYVSSAARVIGNGFANVLNMAAALAAGTTILMGTIYQPSRDLYNLSKSGYRVPAMLGHVHPKFRTPSKNIFIVWAIIVVLLVLGAIAGHTMAFQLIGYYVVWFWCVSWILTLAAAINLRKKHPEQVKTLEWKIPLWPATPVIGFLGILACIVATAIDLYTTHGIGITLAWWAIGILLVPVFYYFVKKHSPEKFAETAD
jgi:amino acid transporter